ncbi:His-Xaa-Ser system protein HxsD [Pseudomonas sp. CR3202]|uniref:His-Xaa-Ser system protein HxsD n=1 Tax=Pseudomonas sp. CR3202 TaxID=3351532 RepID=UPI003BF07DA9
MSWQFSIELDESIYSISAVQRTIYALAGPLSVLLSRREQLLVLDISPSRSNADKTECNSSDEARTLVIRTLNDFALRDLIQKETQGFRELLAKAALKECGV